jgi:hypothetical protein
MKQRSNTDELSFVCSCVRLTGLLRMIIGIAYLQLFIINNFLGPSICLNDVDRTDEHVSVGRY